MSNGFWRKRGTAILSANVIVSAAKDLVDLANTLSLTQRRSFAALRMTALLRITAVLWSVLVPGVAPGSEPPARPLVLQLQWYPQAQFAGYLMAKEKGFFREAGLADVELHWSYAGESPLEQLTTGKADFCTAWLSTTLVARAKGAPLVLLAQVVERSTMLLVARNGMDIRTPQDMNGRKVGLWGGDFDVLPKAFFRKFDLHPEIVPQSTSIVPFLRAGVDVVSAMDYNEYHKLLEAGLREKDLQVFRLSEYGLNFPEDGLYCTEATRRDRPEVCAALVEAVRRGWSYALAHEEETLDVVMATCKNSNVRTNRTHQRWMLRSMGRVLAPPAPGESGTWGRLSQETYDEVAGILREQGLIEQAPAFEPFHQPPGLPHAAAIPDSH
jgi:NitT/TauT family transport system substrate-binding protein